MTAVNIGERGNMRRGHALRQQIQPPLTHNSKQRRLTSASRRAQLTKYSINTRSDLTLFH